MQFRLHSNHIPLFQQYIYRFFDQQKRSFPWRETTNPYHILVSEVMLQQTQTDRVIPKYNAFIKNFPTIKTLAKASPADVIRLWQGLGYNRRGLNLHRAAQQITEQFSGIVPSDLDQLESLAGIGPYTAAAIQAFAFNKPSVVIETNIRTVFIYHFFPNTKQKVDDQALMALIKKTMDSANPHQWYSALMDYGAYLKKVVPNPSRKSKTYQKQSKFEGSNRQIRGKILRLLTTQPVLNKNSFKYHFDQQHTKALQLADALVEEGFITKTQNSYNLKQ